jgi:hypothetical protein
MNHEYIQFSNKFNETIQDLGHKIWSKQQNIEMYSEMPEYAKFIPIIKQEIEALEAELKIVYTRYYNDMAEIMNNPFDERNPSYVKPRKGGYRKKTRRSKRRSSRKSRRSKVSRR